MTIKMKVDGKLVDIGGVPTPVVNQDASGIAVGGTALQKATVGQDGLMTKELVARIVALENIPNANGRSY